MTHQQVNLNSDDYSGEAFADEDALLAEDSDDFEDAE